MTDLLYFTIVGLCIGGGYALAGAGITTLFNGSGVLNFAQGEFVMVAALTVAVLTQTDGNYLRAAMIAVGIVAVLASILGVLYARTNRARTRDIDLIIVSTIGISIMLENLAGKVLGENTYSLRTPFTGQSLTIADFGLPFDYLVILATSVVVFGLMMLFYRTTDTGLQMRAVSEDVTAARLSGLAVGRLTVIAWVLAGVIGGIGGILLGSVLLVSATMGLSLTISAFAAAMIGGLKRPMGALLGGLIIGVAEMWATRYLGTAARQSVAPLVIIFVLLVLPSGILSSRQPAVRSV